MSEQEQLNNKSSLEKRILTWLEKTGFPLEMNAAVPFRKHGFEVRQSSIVLDAQENKPRELDVIAIDPDNLGILSLTCVLECKSSEQPWIVFVSEDALANYNRQFAFSVMSKDARSAIVDSVNTKSELWSKYFARSNRSGYAMRQALNDKDTAYTASMAVLKACDVITRKSYEGTLPSLNFAFPIIVVDTPIFECSKDSDGKLTVKQVRQSEFLFSSYIPDSVGCCIRVVHIDELEEVAKYFRSLCNDFREFFHEFEKNAFKK
ncbi:hypothetical protein [Massilia aquatica]|uniref:DUF4365 domain-containing protein n=1 Tax=Massilia aquatica TaxID=2609000 RepID=A0ABX0MG77_9BURK|nr:hypothetical protein [Massilia aquatica]NHZ41136.1 hypothetical protein [Massilia aquatica]